MNGPPFLVPIFLNGTTPVIALVDSGCDCFCVVRESVARKARLGTVKIQPRGLKEATGVRPGARITELATFGYDIDGWMARAAAYVVPHLDHELILGRPWMDQEGVVLDTQRGVLTIRKAGGLIVQECEQRKPFAKLINLKELKTEKLEREGSGKMWAGTETILTDLCVINRVLADRIQTGGGQEAPRAEATQRIPSELRDFWSLFDPEKAEGLPPHRGTLDHHIRLIKEENGHTPDPPWGPLYSMPREHLLEIRRQITELMDKGWIRASSSSAGAPVLLVKKPNGKWRFCVDYRGLNRITQVDRYPLPLIKETLRGLSQAKWFTKVDVRSAFHRIRIAAGDEHLTAFRTRFGLFEWTVCPFGLAGAPATFQRYINSALGDTLGIFTTAYLDDVLIHSNSSKRDHFEKVKEVLRRLQEARLFLDPEKSVFAAKTVHYLGYVIEAGHSIRPDPEKIRAIQEWEPPKNARGVRGFIGFANFYRDFISHFSEVAAPLHALTRRDATFEWGRAEEKAFQTLKAAFVAHPILAQWDPDLDTVMEADCSGTALGGCLSQWHKDILHPVAYHSASLTAEQRNYSIYDKELTAVVKCIESWTAELMSVRKPFTILTDHKNLEYFTKSRVLSERQHRWAEFLSRFRFKLHFRPGRLAARPDALSRRDQDVGSRQQQQGRVMKPVQILAVRPIWTRPGEDTTALGPSVFADSHLQGLWEEAMRQCDSYHARCKAVRDGARSFPPAAETRQQIGDCTLSAHGTLLWRGVMWLPSWEPLTTAVIQRAHDSPMAGHPGKNTTFQILRRDYHWDGMSADVTRFVRNCHCFAAHPSRQKRQGLLQPLPVADRFWSQISMDFMTNLPQEGEDSPRFLLVITDRLSKYVQLEAMTSMAAEACAKRFRDTWWRFHGFPSQIITDRGSDWLGGFWKTLCKLVGVEQLLSTAHHPQTDGGTERANQEVQAVLRIVVNFQQTDWPSHLPACQLALNNRDSTITGVSPNLLLNGYNVAAIQAPIRKMADPKTPKGRATQFAEHLQEGTELAQAAIAFAQQQQQDAANQKRRPAEKFSPGDKVWFSLRNVKTARAGRKLDWLQAKYTVMATPSPVTVTLDLPGNLHKTVHVDLVERAAEDPLPSQTLVDSRPGPTLGLEEEDEDLREYDVEEVLKIANARGRNKKKVLVKWKGYVTPSWEPLENLQDTEAWQNFTAKGQTRRGRKKS